MTVPRILAASLVVCAFMLWAPDAIVWAQDATIRTNVPLVQVPVTVTDSKGKSMDGLQAEDFLLYDDRVPQTGFRLDTSDIVVAPIALVVAIQSSGISEVALEKIRRVGSLIQPLVAGERGQAAILAYDEEVRLLQDFTRDASKITGAFEIVQARTIKTAHMFDAVAEGVKMLQTRPENYRRMMIVLGESRDRGSKSNLDKAVEAAQRAGVTLYPITYSIQKTAWTAKPDDAQTLPTGPDYAGAIVELGRLTSTNAAERFAATTGGRHLSFTRLDGLEQALSKTADEIHSQYLISFVPMSSSNKGYHRIGVGVKDHPGAVVRARPGYWP
jgi:VWFA-related protein